MSALKAALLWGVLPLVWRLPGLSADLPQLPAWRLPSEEALELARRLAAQPRTARQLARPPEAPLPGPARAGHFRIDVRLVRLLVSVTDTQGRAVTGLGPEDFVIKDNGIPQTISHFEPGSEVLNLLFLLDLSGSARGKQPAYAAAASKLVSVTRPQDRVGISILTGEWLYQISPLVTEREPLHRALQNLPPPAGGTPLYDAVALAYATQLAERPDERNVLILLSDGIEDRLRGGVRPSRVDFSLLERVARRMHAALYVILVNPFTLVPAPDWHQRARANWEKIARITGGRLFHVSSAAQLDPVLPALGEELRSVYTLGYYLPAHTAPGSWHQVEVRVRRPELRIRVRPGYWTP